MDKLFFNKVQGASLICQPKQNVSKLNMGKAELFQTLDFLG